MHNEIVQSNPHQQGQFALRKQRDIQKLIQHQFEIQTNEDNANLFTIVFKGPEETLYREGAWLIQVFLPDQYPLQAPTVTFVNRIFHPNIDWK